MSGLRSRPGARDSCTAVRAELAPAGSVLVVQRVRAQAAAPLPASAGLDRVQEAAEELDVDVAEHVDGKAERALRLLILPA